MLVSILAVRGREDNLNERKSQQSDSTLKVLGITHNKKKHALMRLTSVDYHFVDTQEDFQKLIKEKAFYEHAKIFDNYYGTSKIFNKQNYIDKGHNVLFDIDWQGANNLVITKKRIYQKFLSYHLILKNLKKVDITKSR